MELNQIQKKICIFGVGRMGSALLTGLSNNGYPKDKFKLIVRNPIQNQYLVEDGFYCKTELDNIDDLDIIFIAVKPKDINTVLSQINQANPHRKMIPIVSVCAAYSYLMFERKLGKNYPVFRIRPNIFININQGNILFCENQEFPIINVMLETLFKRLGTVYKCNERLLSELTWNSSTLSGVILSKIILESFKEIPVNEHKLNFEVALSGLEAFCMYLKNSLKENKDLNQALKHLLNNIASPLGLNEVIIQFLNEENFFHNFNQAKKLYFKKEIDIEQKLTLV